MCSEVCDFKVPCEDAAPIMVNLIEGHVSRQGW